MPADEVLLRLYEEAFPSVSAETRARFRSFLATDARDHKWVYAATPRSNLSQGDIIAQIPAFYYDGSKVRVSKEHGPAILLEHECDMSVDEGDVCRNPQYVFAPLMPFERVKQHFSDPSGLTGNLITHKIFFNTVPGLGDAFVADLNLIGSLDAQWLHQSLRSGTLKRVASLSENGFLFLLAKLTVHFLRANAEAAAPRE